MSLKKKTGPGQEVNDRPSPSLCRIRDPGLDYDPFLDFFFSFFFSVCVCVPGTYVILCTRGTPCRRRKKKTARGRCFLSRFPNETFRKTEFDVYWKPSYVDSVKSVLAKFHSYEGVQSSTRVSRSVPCKYPRPTPIDYRRDNELHLHTVIILYFLKIAKKKLRFFTHRQSNGGHKLVSNGFFDITPVWRLYNVRLSTFRINTLLT